MIVVLKIWEALGELIFWSASATNSFSRDFDFQLEA